jgi:hypothetical protein
MFNLWRAATSALAVAAVASVVAPAAARAGAPAAAVTGQYVEARSAAVHAGACHFNGELTTAGREAVLAWKIAAGVLDGVGVDGLSLVAVVAGADNLADRNVARRSVLYVSDRATPAQRDVLVKHVTKKFGDVLGTVVAVKTAPQRITLDAATISVSSGDTARINASRYPCSHCVMPAQVWYQPLTKVNAAAVAQGIDTGFKEPALGVSWSHEASDNVYVGSFTL